MLYALNRDDPRRVADFGYFPSERQVFTPLTGNDLADAIQSGRAPKNAPFKDWLPKLLEGCRFELDLSEILVTFQNMLDDERTTTVAMDILNDVAYELYGTQS